MKIIYNPTAGGGRSERHRQRLEKLLKGRGQSYRLLPTEKPGHATQLAHQLVAEGEGRVVVMGGDGTIGEAVNGLLGSDCELGLIPVGTGNDLARSLGLPFNNVGGALEVLEKGGTKAIDIGWERDRHFILMTAIGYPAHVAEETNRMTRLKGSLAFFAAVYKALGRMKPISVRMWLDDEERELNCTSILLQNTPYCGGGQFMAPQASLEDGKLDVVVIAPVGKLDLMLNFPRIYRGTHVTHPAFSVHRASHVRIETETPMRKMFDGDICGETPLEARAMRAALRVVVPLE
ncbi:MAG TPA: diacylglycerol kinase family protein [Acidobacteriota bacterium]|nr:diacylglycerol kinase family protein [Acidobacteriota bacterium]